MAWIGMKSWNGSSQILSEGGRAHTKRPLEATGKKRPSKDTRSSQDGRSGKRMKAGLENCASGKVGLEGGVFCVGSWRGPVTSSAKGADVDVSIEHISLGGRGSSSMGTTF